MGEPMAVFDRTGYRKSSALQSTLLPTFILAFMLLLSSSVFQGTAHSQVSPAVTETWRSIDYGFTSRMIELDAGNNVFALGDTVLGDYLTLRKFSPSGALQWQRSYDPAERLRGVWVDVDGSGDAVAVATVIAGSNATPSGWLILKYDDAGNLLWSKSLPGSFSDVRRVQIDASGNIYVAGVMWLTNSSGTISRDSVLIKYAPDGTKLWTASFDGAGAVDEPFALAISPDNSRIGITGVSGHLFMGLVYDSNGNRIWADTGTTYSGSDLAFGAGNATFLATGTYHLGDPNTYQMAIAKYDAAGNKSWVKSYSVGDKSLRIAIDPGGNLVATGYDQVAGGYVDWMTIKTDSTGNLLWSRRYDGGRNNDEWPEGLAVDTAGSVYVTGTGGPNPSSGTISYLKGVVAKYSSGGEPQWAVWDPYLGGKAMRLGPGSSVFSLGFGYFAVNRYDQTGLTDSVPATPSALTGIPSFTGSAYAARLDFTDNADNEFWVEAERCTGSGCTGFEKVSQTRGENAFSLEDRTVQRGVTYTYRVRARGFMGASGTSNTVEVTIPPVSPPAAPSNLTAAVTTDSAVELKWHDNSTNEVAFYVERCEGAGCGNFAGTGWSNANQATWVDYLTSAGKSYSYRVHAWNSDGYSSYSNVASVIVPGNVPSTPAAPANLSAQSLSNSQIRLAWTNGGPQDGVKIERCKGSTCTNFVQIATVTGAATSFDDSGLAAATSYRYRVRAYNSAGDSPYSNIAGAKTRRR